MRSISREEFRGIGAGVAAVAALSGSEMGPLLAKPPLAKPPLVKKAKKNTGTGYGAWEAGIGSDPSTPALPDYYCNYFAYSFDRREGDNQYIGLRITGEYGYARYMSYNIYEDISGDSTGDEALTDFEIEPDEGNVNPFRLGSDPQALNRQYTIAIVPRGYPPPDDVQNVLSYVADVDEVPVIGTMIRYYVPQVNETANVELPTITAFDLRTGNEVSLPPLYSITGIPLIIFTRRMQPLFRTVIDDVLRFQNVPSPGLFPNADNIYLASAAKIRPDRVLVLRLKPPTFPHTNGESGDSDDVRYWSFNQCYQTSTTAFGMRDEQFSVASDGFVYVAMGPEYLRRVAERAGYNFMGGWKPRTTKAVIIYRNLLTNPTFEGNMEKVPLLNLKENPTDEVIKEADAKNYIGEYAPTGLMVHRNDFLRGRLPSDLAPPKN